MRLAFPIHNAENRINTRFKTLLYIFLAAIAIRLLMFALLPVDWNWDSYHHWQIAYYTLKIGLAHGRMWDLMGSEYYWPPFPILLESLLMGILNIFSILPLRAVNIISGSLSACLGYLVVKQYPQDSYSALLAAAIIAVSPIGLVIDILALSETLGLTFLLLSLYLYFIDRHYYCGLALALSCLSRLEPIVFMPVFALFVSRKSKDRLTGLIPFVAGWLTLMLPYFYVWTTHTGDYIYSYRFFITTFFAFRYPSLVAFSVGRLIGAALVAVSVLAFLLRIHKKRTLDLMFSIFLLYSFATGGVLLVSPVAPQNERYYLLFIAISSIFVSQAMMQLKKLIHNRRLVAGMNIAAIATVSILVLAQIYPTYYSYSNAMVETFKIADWIGERYSGGTIVSEMPMITYRLIDQWHIKPENMQGAHYIPTDPEDMEQWLKRYDVRWIVYTTFLHDFTNRVFPYVSLGQSAPPFTAVYQAGAITIYKIEWAVSLGVTSFGFSSSNHFHSWNRAVTGFDFLLTDGYVIACQLKSMELHPKQVECAVISLAGCL